VFVSCRLDVGPIDAVEDLVVDASRCPVGLECRQVVASRWVNMGVDDFVELAEAVEVIRGQLQMARESGEGQTPQFTVAKVEVELAVEIRREGGLKVGVPVFGISGGGSSAATHRVRLELVPEGEDGGSFRIRDRAPGGPPPQ